MNRVDVAISQAENRKNPLDPALDGRDNRSRHFLRGMLNGIVGCPGVVLQKKTG